MNRQYAILTGGKNNAGDFYIIHRARELLRYLRPDREIVEFNRWEPLDEERLAIVNASSALLLVGGPSVQHAMYPDVFPLRSRLDEITSPIALMGAGWKSTSGSWEAAGAFKFTHESRPFLDCLAASRLTSSVRDYHTLKALHAAGVDNVLMTGCPALFSIEHIGCDPVPPTTIQRISISTGVGFVKSSSQSVLQKELFLEMRKAFPGAEIVGVFHHSLDYAKIASSYGGSPYYRSFAHAHEDLQGWLESNGFGWTDISGGAEAMMETYSKTDIHVGFRVHAHILMSGTNRPSFLLNEDGRGTALQMVIGGLALDSFSGMDTSISGKILRKLGFSSDHVITPPARAQDVAMLVKQEIAAGYPCLRAVRGAIDARYITMRRFIEALP